MKTAQVVFNASRLVLGTSHLVFQTLADASMNAEAKIIDKTGYWENGKQYKLTDHQLNQYKAQRKVHTKHVQRKAKAKYNKLSAMIEAKKQVAFKQV